MLQKHNLLSFLMHLKKIIGIIILIVNQICHIMGSLVSCNIVRRSTIMQVLIYCLSFISVLSECCTTFCTASAA